MVKLINHLCLILACVTLMPDAYASMAVNAIKAIGVGSAFGAILPTALGVASHHLEEKMGLRSHARWTAENHVSTELNKLLQISIITGISALNWALLGGFVPNDIRASLILSALYCYGQGRAFYRADESKLGKGSSYLLPCAIALLAYRRVPELSPFMDVAGKYLLVFGSAHICGA